ncbi:MAG TPA: isochorismatase family protein [Burkholderiales bacterium]|jgi:maleamate amidohydrolase|nr:isochorismatase family protein [Burkholderiales bacterium]
MQETDIYRKQNFGNRIGFGRKTALVIVDFTVAFNDPALFGGGNIDAAVKQTVGLLDFFRQAGLPVAFTRVVYAEDGSDAGVFCMKVPSLRMLTENHPAGQIVPELAPRAGELIVRKTQASAFFGTGLAPWLVQQGCDTVVVVGCTTSGCVRASVIDAISHNFRPILARDCVGDRALGPHDASLFDMGQKYADLLRRDEIVAQLARLARAA